MGTITFCCPEIVQHLVYTDKADVWSLARILYNVMLLSRRSPPNIFNITKIVEGKFDPEITSREEVPWYSDELKGLVGRMLTTSAEERPRSGTLWWKFLAGSPGRRTSCAERSGCWSRRSTWSESTL